MTIEKILMTNERELDQMIGQSPSMQALMKEALQIAKSNASVFITGESGTGKEVLANFIHTHSLRKNHSFVRVNCAAIPESLIESEFFGHEKGSFTGALTKRVGRFELAHRGTLLLDEVTEISIHLQSKLLRVVQEQEFERVGGVESVKVDVRLISTSNRNVKEAIDSKKIREDLFYRLNVIPIHLPPLRDRREDIIPLAEFFLKRFCLESKLAIKEFLPDAKKRLLDYPWPGNIRELANIIERAVVLNPSEKIDGHNLFLEDSFIRASHLVLPMGTTLEELEKRLIIQTLEANLQNRTKTAKTLGISIRTLRNKLNLYNNTPQTALCVKKIQKQSVNSLA